MPATATRPRRLALACALITAVTLGTVSASAATASDTPDSTSTASDTASKSSEHPEPPRGGRMFAVKYEPTDEAPEDVNEANRAFASCMREEDQSVFPSFHAYKDDDGSVRLDVKMKGRLHKLSDDGLKGFREALLKCAPIMEEAGLSLPDKDDLPDRPKLPGRPDVPKHPDRPGLPKHHEWNDENGENTEVGLPSLVTTVKET
ncbi:hypothetical protein [Streptomyces sp. NPDC050704]|uniref:hypothetical protein n=1 Tax=Streptomyces sp. NPDC050704 TaxID=3157219 RepID=UPI003444CC39